MPSQGSAIIFREDSHACRLGSSGGTCCVLALACHMTKRGKTSVDSQRRRLQYRICVRILLIWHETGYDKRLDDYGARAGKFVADIDKFRERNALGNIRGTTVSDTDSDEE